MKERREREREEKVWLRKRESTSNENGSLIFVWRVIRGNVVGLKGRLAKEKRGCYINLKEKREENNKRRLLTDLRHVVMSTPPDRPYKMRG